MVQLLEAHKEQQIAELKAHKQEITELKAMIQMLIKEKGAH